MKKADRQKIFNKYNGRCAYCGCELQKGWHVDEIEPVRRIWKNDYNSSTGSHYKKFIGFSHPERMSLENQNPACASCNINKHSDGLEEFRNMIKHFIVTLNRDSVQYKIAKRYGLIQETNIEVKFYFEKPSSEFLVKECDARDDEQKLGT